MYLPVHVLLSLFGYTIARGTTIGPNGMAPAWRHNFSHYSVAVAPRWTATLVLEVFAIQFHPLANWLLRLFDI